MTIFHTLLDTSILDVFRKDDIVWNMMKSQLDLAKFFPTWAAYNSLYTGNLRAITKFSSLPVANGNPID